MFLLLFTDFDWHYFWQWTDFQSYIDFLIVMSIFLSIITFIFLHNVIFIEIIGFLALLTEAMLGVPQLVKNIKNQSTKGMRYTSNILKVRYGVRNYNNSLARIVCSNCQLVVISQKYFISLQYFS